MIINEIDDWKGFIIELDNYNIIKYKEEYLNKKNGKVE